MDNNKSKTVKLDRKHIILKEKNIGKGLLRLAIPIMLANLLRSLHDLVDMVFVSKPLGDEAVTSISVTWPVIFFTLSIGIGISVAGTSIISQYLGSNNKEKAHKTAGQLLMFSLLLGLILNILLFAFIPNILTLMNISGFEYIEAIKYVRIRSFELIPVFVFFAFQSSRMAAGDTTSPVYLSTAAVIINIILSPILISVFNLGVSGAAYATLAANILIIPVGLYLLFFDKKSEIKISVSDLKFDAKVIYDLVRIGVPASAAQSITAVGFAVLNAVIYSYGTSIVSAFSVGNRISSLIMMPVMGIGGILSTFIGQNVGAFNQKRAIKTFKVAMKMSFSFMLIGAIILLPIREYILLLFFDKGTQTMELAKEYMIYLLAGLPLMGIFQTYLGTFNGTGNTTYSMILSISRLWLLRLPIILVFSKFTNLGSSGIWYAMLISNVVAAVIGYILYKYVDFLPKVEVEKNDEGELEFST